MSNHIEIEVTLLEIIDDAFPVWLSFELVDRHGVRHQFIDKAPVIIGPKAPIPTSFPSRAYVTFTLAERHDDFVIVHMQEPEGLVSSEGDILFEIPVDRIKPEQTEWVYVFHGEQARFASAVFSEIDAAQEWIKAHALTGVLTAYPLDISVLNWAMQTEIYTPNESQLTSPKFVAGFTSASQEHFHFRDGRRI